MQRILHVGPTLPGAADLLRDTGIKVLPPVAAGDLLRSDLRAGDVVGIIDGYFHQVGAVRHKEILLLLDRGVRVFGASSMGALRAVELHPFGMVGIGGIFAAYRDGELEADDEVCLLHSPAEEDFRPLSETLVAMRATLALAVGDGVCDQAECDDLVSALSRRHFSDRSYGLLPSLATSIGMPAARAEELMRFCRSHRQDPKRDDAWALIKVMTGMPERDTTAPVLPERCARTSYLHVWEIAAAGRAAGDPGARTADINRLRVMQLMGEDYPRRYEELVLERIEAECRAQCGDRGAEPAGDTTETALRHGAHRGFYRWPGRAAKLPFLKEWTTAGERSRLSVREQLVRFLVRSYRWGPGVLPDEAALAWARTQPAWANAGDLNDRAWEINDRITAQRDGLSIAAINDDLVLDMVATCWEATREDLPLAALDRGLGAVDSVIAAAKPYYLFFRYGDGTSLRSDDGTHGAHLSHR
ncbi:hypothetical protein B0E53_03390 [Micromonospora sp. MH33]|uniref:TfuA-like protein n=1 Tax=Micromonospora sp. MH33 TaxID=1945509 RepID=UPI000D2D4D6D|nr:TfuA-like protein [Micromonospora sp. MH33]PSK64664.1 hypothetical protein B0E53_03390 [Micromonospora sp. MH33]